MIAAGGTVAAAGTTSFAACPIGMRSIAAQRSGGSGGSKMMSCVTASGTATMHASAA